MKKALGPKHLLKGRKIVKLDRAIPGMRYNHLCPIGRKTDKKHYHEDVSERSFYHRVDLMFCSITIYFETVTYPKTGRRLTYPYNLNISPLGTAIGWKDASPITEKRAKRVGRLVRNLLLESRMMRKGVSKKRARGSKTKSPGRKK